MKPRLWLAGFVCVCGCASKKEVFTDQTAPEYMTTCRTDFYLHGPAQPGTPERLSANTFVHLKSKEPGYSVVQLEDGRNGYVATDDMKVAPPTGQVVSAEQLFPDRFLPPPMPEPDLTMPVGEIPSGTNATTKAR